MLNKKLMVLVSFSLMFQGANLWCGGKQYQQLTDQKPSGQEETSSNSSEKFSSVRTRAATPKPKRDWKKETRRVLKALFVPEFNTLK